MTEPIPARVAERAATRFAEDENGCFISTYSVGTHGYAQIGWQTNGQIYMTTAHRAAWVHYSGEQPEGTIDHTNHCDRRCVRGSHLRDISNFENARRNRPDASPDLSTCLNGHVAPIREIVVKGKVHRTCHQCWQESQARYNHKESTRMRKQEWEQRRRAERKTG